METARAIPKGEGEDYNTLRKLRSILNQQERYLYTRLFGIGFHQVPEEDLRNEMDLSKEEFRSVLDAALEKLRRAGRGG